MGISTKESLKRRVSAATWRVGTLCVALAAAIITVMQPMLSESASPEITLLLNPTYIYAGKPAQVRAVATLSSDVTLVASSVSLYHIDDSGKQIFIDYLYDDGTHGDAATNDNLFSNVLISSETQPRMIKYQVSAYYGGVRKSSPIAYLVVKPGPNLEGLWAGFVEKMVERDLSGALLYFRESRRAEYRASYETVGMDRVSAAFQTAGDLQCKRIWMGEAEYTFSITMGSATRTGTMIFYLDSDSAWRIDSLDFE